MVSQDEYQICTSTSCDSAATIGSQISRLTTMEAVEPTVQIMQNGTNEARNSEALDSAPVLLGTTKYQPDPSFKNILVTGGAGFMYLP